MALRRLGKAMRNRAFQRLATLLLAWMAAVIPVRADLPQVIDQVQPKIVKVFGAGGFRGLEAYQSGFLISEDGQILTAWSYVLDTDDVRVTLADGRRMRAVLLGADALHEIALLKIDASELPHFDLDQSIDASSGAPVLAFSNVFGIAVGDEAASVQHGIVAVKAPLTARRGVYDIPYRGAVYILDAMTNNPGAAGGALVTYDGQLVGVLGKEVRNAETNTWLNYAIPAHELAPLVQKLASGQFLAAPDPTDEPPPAQPLSLSLLGVVPVPDVVERTPPYIDVVHPGSPAASAGLLPDDLIVSVEDRLVPSLRALKSELARIDQADAVKLTVLRSNTLLEVQLRVEK
jgi:serine protease Do